MGYIFLRILVNALAIAIVTRLLPGFEVANNDLGTYIIIGLVFGIVNALVKPIITFLTCSLVLFTLGLFILVINGLMLWMTDPLLPTQLRIENFWWAILGGIIISVINMVIEGFIADRDTTTIVRV